jgi:hypothetical protein
MQLDSLILLAEGKRGEYERFSLEKINCDHFSCALGDIFGDGRMHLATGSFSLSETQKLPQAVTIWKNLGPSQAAPGR